MKTFTYTGVGSRQTPADICKLMTKIASRLEKKNYTLRSGGAVGADSAFEKGVEKLKEIYFANDATEEAMKIASSFHPAWHRCKDYVRKLHARNVFQVLGKDLKTPSDFLICWTPEGSGSGGTGQAIRIATHYQIPIYDMGIPEVERKLRWHFRLL